MKIIVEEIEGLLISLNKTKFRGLFHLNDRMKDYVRDKGLKKIERDAYDLVVKELHLSL